MLQLILFSFFFPTTLHKKLDFIPPSIRAIEFRINYRNTDTNVYSKFVYHTTVTQQSTVFSYTLSSLKRNTTYEIYIRAQGEYQWCPYNELIGNNSESVNLTTKASGMLKVNFSISCNSCVYPIHVCIQFMCVSNSCVYPIHVCIQFMCVSNSCVYPIHVCIQFMCVSNSCVYPIHVCIQFMCVSNSCVYPIRVCIQFVCVSNSCVYPIHVCIQFRCIQFMCISNSCVYPIHVYLCESLEHARIKSHEIFLLYTNNTPVLQICRKQITLFKKKHFLTKTT